MVEIDGAMIPSVEVLEAEAQFLLEYLVEFFLDSDPPYQVIRDHFRQF